LVSDFRRLFEPTLHRASSLQSLMLRLNLGDIFT
jgi:hypothetical protein